MINTIGTNESGRLMHDIWNELAGFLNRGEAGVMLKPLEEKLGRLNLRAAIIDLFKWMRTRHRFKNNRPLVLETEYPRTAFLRQLVSEVEPLAAVLDVNEKQIQFSEHVSEKERLEILAYVDAEFRPRLHVYHRPPGRTRE
ncbi:hypothetical protein V6x_07410 [Gimesia chilikensis]|uniref:Uncharacterized protein n=3 Tax=Gimesia chilikensis TaxID=2605989 RepID=A0A517W754_9PLAN|nr:hypothetical protein V6x_07410 [Gimesia chilikensis]